MKMKWSSKDEMMILKADDAELFRIDMSRVFSHGNVAQFLSEYGLKQFLSDKFAGVKAPAERIEILQNWRTRLYSGEHKAAPKAPKTELEKALNLLKTLERDMAEQRELLLTQGIDEKTAKSLIVKLWAVKITDARDKVVSLTPNTLMITD